MAELLQDTLARAVREGVLPAGAQLPGGGGRPWPVTLLTALGAWLAAVPLLGAVSVLLGPLINNTAGPYLIGALVLGAAVVVLHARGLPLFVEQLGVPALLVGGGSLGFGLYRDLPDAAASLVLAALAVAVAWWVPRAWLRGLLGALAAGLVGAALVEHRLWPQRSGWRDAQWLACHGLLAAGLALAALAGRVRRHGAFIESLQAGWWLTTLAALAALAGMSFLVGGAMGGGFVGEVAREVGSLPARRSGWHLSMSGVSALLALAGTALAARAWPGLRRAPLAVVAGVLAVLGWWMPTLGAVVLGLALLATTQRWRLAGAAGLAAAWIVGAFYYALAWPLATKALVLVVCGALLGAVAGWLWPRGPRTAARAALRLDARAAAVGVATLLTLAVAGYAIWDKQQLIARGQPVYVELAPVDPRSLMQGDYMRLNFRLPAGTDGVPTLGAERPYVVAQRDARGVATLRRLARPGEALAADELRVELTPQNRGWTLVSDAWYFREGEGERWAQARYGEFRVTPEGRALLVGLADEKLQAIVP